MKFKAIFIIFNIVIFFSFLFIFLMPLMMLGWEYTQLFWANNWFLAAFFLIIMGILNAYFIRNWKLFGYLENEDWQGLTGYLENRIYREKHISRQHVRLLINTYLVRSQPESIAGLEKHLRQERPGLLSVFALPLGVPYLIRNSPEAMEGYFKAFLTDPKVRDRDWIRFNYAFSLILQQRTGEARDILFDLSTSVRNHVLLLLSAYFLHNFYPGDETVRNAVETATSFFRKKYTVDTWAKQLERLKTNLEVVVLSQLIQEAGDWMFQETVTEDHGFRVEDL